MESEYSSVGRDNSLLYATVGVRTQTPHLFTLKSEF